VVTDYTGYKTVDESKLVFSEYKAKVPVINAQEVTFNFAVFSELPNCTYPGVPIGDFPEKKSPIPNSNA
jgi:hypothetical protein